MTSNPYKKSDEKKKVAPGGKPESVVKEEPTPEVQKPAITAENLLAGMIEQKPEGKSCGFYLSAEAIEKLEKLAKQNKCSKSKALDTLLRSLL